MTARKKRNNMMTFSNTSSAGALIAIANTPLVLNGNATGRVLWQATAMSLKAGSVGKVQDTGVRTATSCYMVGLSEHIKLQTSSPLPWYHRRICFTSKDPDFRTVQPGDSPAIPYATALEGTTSYIQRLMYNSINGGGVGNTIAAKDEVIFKGIQNVDWNDPLLAPVDNSRVTVKFDKTWILRSGNQNGNVWERKLYHPMKKTLVYDDEESGNTMVTSINSVRSKAGMGDFWVYDIYVPGLNGQASDQLVVYANSTLYWHEK